MKPTPVRPSNNPFYLLALVVGSFAFALGGAAAVMLYIAGGRELAVIGICIGLIVFAGVFSAILRLRDRDGTEP